MGLGVCSCERFGIARDKEFEYIATFALCEK
jgi:hypothetical protein